jgi:hypothetical protein
LWVVVVLVGVVLDVGVVVDVDVVFDEEELLPQAATAMVHATRASSVSMAVSGVLLMGRAPVVDPRLGGPPYQAPATLAEHR